MSGMRRWVVATCWIYLLARQVDPNQSMNQSPENMPAKSHHHNYSEVTRSGKHMDPDITDIFAVRKMNETSKRQDPRGTQEPTASTAKAKVMIKANVKLLML
jgi:hypothetical protein